MGTVGKVILHTILICITGGFWIIPLVVYAIVKKKNA